MENTKTNKWGGKRVNAGRKRGKVKGKPKTKPCRITHHQCDFIKTGKLTELMNLLYEWKQKKDFDSKAETSPRWQRMNEFMQEVEGILGADGSTWIDENEPASYPDQFGSYESRNNGETPQNQQLSLF